MSVCYSIAMLFGAGFSMWAAGLPVASRLFDFAVEPWGPREATRLERLRSLKAEWDQAYTDGFAEQFIADVMTSQAKHAESLLWYIVRRLSDPFIWTEYHAQRDRRHVLMIDENRKYHIEGVVKAQRLIQWFYGMPLAGIVTTNYDMLVEYALGSRGFNYGIPNEVLTGRGPYPISTWQHPVMLTGTVSLAKIHGSVSWDESGHYTDGRRGLTGHALIVAPTPEKQPPEAIVPVWRLAEQILERVTRLVVFGFAFNPYDEAVLNLLRSAGRNVEAVLLIDIAPKTQQAQQLWPRATITSCLPPPEGNPVIRDWVEAWL